MLARVASHLYWLSRYLERAENMARILDVGASLALLSGQGDERAAIEPLIITDTLESFHTTGQAPTPEQVARFLAWGASHPSSIVNCLEASRENARAVRGSVTSEMWENINDTWLQLLTKRGPAGGPIDASFFEWVKERSHLFRGITFATIRRDQPYQFIRLGTFLERADNTARILSVKQARQGVAGDEGDGVDLADHYRLSAVLRSVSALEAYRDTYRDAIDTDRVSELLIFNPRVPRSLHFCLDETDYILKQLPQQTGREARKRCANLLSNLKFGSLSEVYDSGLGNYLEVFVKENIALAQAVQTDYLESIA
jgi:uncharacterized alpha-E superfamily protein